MAKLKAFSDTKISLAKTHEQLEDLLEKQRVEGSRWTHLPEKISEHKPGRVLLEFEVVREDCRFAYRISVDYQSKAGPRGGNQGTTREQTGRALFWHVKNLFDAIEYGIISLEEALLPYMITGNGQTVYEQLEPKLAQLSAGDVPRIFPAIEDRRGQ